MSIVIRNQSQKPATKKTSKRKPIRKARRVKRSKPQQNGNRIPPALQHHLCTITDPFCPAAKGARWPDSNSQPTIAITLQGIVPIQTDAAGNFAASFGVDPIRGYRTWQVDPANGDLTSPTNTAYNGALQFDGISEFRLVSGGVQVFSTASLQTSAGMLRAIEVSSTESNLNTGLNAFSYDYTRTHDKPVREFGSVFQYLRPGGPESRNFNEFTIGATSTYDWTTSLICLTGGEPTTQVGMIYYVFHYEYKFAQSNIMNKLASPAPGDNAFITTLSNYVGKEAGGIIEGYQHQVQETMSKHALDYIKKLLKQSVNALPPQYSMPANLLLNNI